MRGILLTSIQRATATRRAMTEAVPEQRSTGQPKQALAGTNTDPARWIEVPPLVSLQTNSIAKACPMRTMQSAALATPGETLARCLPSVLHSPVMRVALVGPLPPRRCGLATFTADVKASLVGLSGWRCDVVAVVDDDNPFDGTRALMGIRQQEPSDYTRAAERLNHSGVDVVSLQHEFGIYGGADGEYVTRFLTALRVPVVTTLHTVLEHPSLNQRLIMAAILRHSAQVIVMARKGAEILTHVYGADPEKLSVCAHGAPDRPLAPSEGFKEELGLADHQVLLTFGLLSRGKGLETMIAAMPAIVRAHPKAIYVILGATHPHMIKQSGETYREGLMAMAETLGVRDNVRFIDAFVDLPLLLSYLGAADIYVTPYMNEAQVTSGTLAYAVALGKPVVSTPYWHAKELVDERSGALVGFGDAEGFSKAIRALLDDPKMLSAAGAIAWGRGRSTIWARSADHYARSFEAVTTRHAPNVEVAAHEAASSRPDLRRVAQVTDSCGILQHSSYGVANRAHGYCVDDNARGLILVQRWRAQGLADERLDSLERTYAAFLQHAWNPDSGHFRNFMGYDRSWLEDAGSEDSNGRVCWALGEVARQAVDPDMRIWAQELAKQAFASFAALTSLRARCFAILGADGFLAVDPRHALARQVLSEAAENLMERIETHGHETWVWFEPSLSYDNARLPQALLVAGQALRRPDMIDAGLRSLSWLDGIQRASGGVFRPVGSRTPSVPYAPPANHDQQPLEAAATVDAALAAFDISRHPTWLRMARTALAWFHGGNDCGLALSDGTGGCFDGLRPNGLNLNQGAESILALQMASAAMARTGNSRPGFSMDRQGARP